MLRMDKVYVIRYKVWAEGNSIRSVVNELGVGRNAAARYLTRSEPVRRRSVPRPRPIMDKAAPPIDELLAECSHRVTQKQRLTGTGVHHQFVEEHYPVGTIAMRDYLQ